MRRTNPRTIGMKLNKYWWRYDRSEEPHDAIFEALNNLRASIDERNMMHQKFYEIFMNRPVENYYPSGPMNVPRDMKDIVKTKKREMQIFINAIESCVSTLAARIASQRPKPKFLTSLDGPDMWEMGMKAEQLEKFVIGTWVKERVYQKVVKIFYDAAIVGFGAMKVSPGDGRINFERVFPGEIIVDERGATFSEPRSLYTRKYVPAELLLAKYDGEKQSINAITQAIGSKVHNDLTGGDYVASDLIEVVEGWHLPSGYGAEDGKHIICIENHTLDYNEWTRDRFPFAFYKWDETPIGWYPIGLVERERPMQEQVNKLLQRVQKAMHLFSTARVVVEKGSVDKKQLTNEVGAVIEYNVGSQPPRVDTPPSMSSEVFNHLWEIYNKIFENSGVSQMAATSRKPPGLESGRAIREFHGLFEGRFALKEIGWEDLFIELSEQTVEVGKEVFAGSKKGFKARYIDRNSTYAEAIDWADVDMDRDQYELQVFPTSALPSTPAGRLATVEEMANAGFIDEEEARDLIRFPDLGKELSLESAARRDIDMQINEMLGKGVAVEPEEYQDLQYGLRRVTSAMLWAKRRGAPEDRIDLMMDWLYRAKSLITQKVQQEQPQMPPGPPQPMPPGMTPPPIGGLPNG